MTPDLAEIAEEVGRFARASGLRVWIEAPDGAVQIGEPGPPARFQAPLAAGGVRLGTLCLSGGDPGAVERWGDYLSASLSRTADHELTIADFVQTTARNWKEINFLLGVGRNLAVTMTIPETCAVVLAMTVRLLGANRAGLLLVGDDGLLEVAAAHGVDPGVADTVRIKPGHGVAGWVFAHATPFLATRDSDLPADMVEAHGEEALLSAPLMVVPLGDGDRPLGVIGVSHPRRGAPFTAEDLTLLQTAAFQTAAAIRNTRLVAQVKVTERLQKEIETAAAVQKQLLPRENPRVPGFEVAGWYRPTAVVGGDYYDFVPVARAGAEAFYCLIADISGHGLASALFMSSARSAVRALVGAMPRPQALAEALNERIVDDAGTSGMFLTAVFGRVDSPGHRIVLFNCGHPAPVVMHPDGTTRMVEPGSPPIGIVPVLGGEEEEIDLDPGDVLLLYTDGLVEAMDPHEEMFGLDRLLSALSGLRREPLPSIAAGLFQAVRAFAAGGELRDDLTIVLLRRTAHG